jgi:hypothetical protein
MRGAFPRVYQSFQEFEREELRKLDSFSGSLEDMLDEMCMDELDFDDKTVSRSRRRDDDGD